MVRLDGLRRAANRDGFNDIRIQSALHQEGCAVRAAGHLSSKLIEHGDKFSTNPGDDPVVLAVPFGKRASMLDPSKSVANAGFRVYHEIERSVIAPEARGFLLQMVELGLLSDSDQEFLIDRIMLSGISSATLEDVKELVTNTIFHFDSSFSTQGRLMLNGSDRVH